MLRSITAATLILAAGCAAPRPAPLVYAQYRCLEPGMTADAVRAAFGPPAAVTEQVGVTRALSYRCRNESGDVFPLWLEFDENGRLTRWKLG